MERILLYLCCVLLIYGCRKETAAAAPVTEPAAVKKVPNRARRYTADTTATHVNWAGFKPTGKHAGTLKLLKGKLYTQNDTLANGSFVLDMTSITVTDPASGADKVNLENHLKGLGKEADADHFFNTLKYPQGKFDITGISREKTGRLMIEGNLTLKDITHNLKFPATVQVYRDSVILISDAFRIDRTLWNINYSSKNGLQNLGDKYINDDIELQLTVKARR